MNQPTNKKIKFPLSLKAINRQEHERLPLNIREGRLPHDLQGHVFIVAPAGTFNWDKQPGCFHLNGDGMIYRIDFNPANGLPTLKTKLVKPPDYYVDEITSPLWEEKALRFGNHGLMRFALLYGFRDQLNTAFLRLKFNGDQQERLLITYDAGRPYEIDPNTLKVLSPIGKLEEWQPEFQVVGHNFLFPPFLSTAHPVFDTYTKEMFTVNYGRSLESFMKLINDLPQHLKEELDKIVQRIAGLEDFLYLIRWNGDNSLRRWKLVNAADNSPVAIQQSLHQIGLTEKYIVLMDTAMTVGIEQILNNPAPENKQLEELLRKLLETLPSADNAVYIVRREDLQLDRETARAYKVTIPREAVHFLTDYRNPNNQITLHVAHISAWDIAEWTRSFDVYPDHKTDSSIPPAYAGGSLPAELQGILPGEMDLGAMGRHVIYADTLGSDSPKIESKLVFDGDKTWGTGFLAYLDLLPSGMIPDKLDNIYCTSFGLWQDLVTKYMCDRYKKYEYRQIELKTVLQYAAQGKPSCLYRLNATSNESLAIADCYTADPGYMLLSCQFVPSFNSNPNSTNRPPLTRFWESCCVWIKNLFGNKSNGYIVCSVFTPNGADNKPGMSEIWIFDAGNLKQGPVCKLFNEQFQMGLSLHSTWLPKIGSHQGKYQVSVQQEYASSVETLPAELKDKIQEVFRALDI